ncbi:MAG: C39 family peptidase [Alphaproteobacteria bacterium]
MAHTNNALKLLAAALALAASAVLTPQVAQAGNVAFWGYSAGDMDIKVKSLKEARFARVVKQQYDFSCGSAALATLLSYHYDQPVSETAVFRQMFAVGDQKHIERYGFSLLDMKRYLESHNYLADGFRISLSRLRELGVPAITLIQVKGYRHFVVVKGIDDSRVLLGDPARGVRSVNVKDFDAAWNGIAFIVRNNADVGKQHFNLKQDWDTLATTPYGVALARQSLASFTVNLKDSLPNSF